MLDLHWREVVVFAPMLAVVLWMGIYPSSFLKPMQPTLARVMDRVSHQAASNGDATPQLQLAQH
jgi:NADH-quinone oxidoreductase subunit M